MIELMFGLGVVMLFVAWRMADGEVRRLRQELRVAERACRVHRDLKEMVERRCAFQERVIRHYEQEFRARGGSLDAGPKGSWEAVMGFPAGYRPRKEEVEQRYRHLAKKRHPDVGGSVAAMATLNLAKREALRAAQGRAT